MPARAITSQSGKQPGRKPPFAIQSQPNIYNCLAIESMTHPMPARADPGAGKPGCSPLCRALGVASAQGWAHANPTQRCGALCHQSQT
eukprot:1149245-Pelagomonas_calceolata.AAC.3